MPNLRKIVVRTLTVLGGGLLVLGVAVIAIFYIIFSPSRDQVSRVASPSGDFVATVIEINGGATTSFGYEVRIARKGFNVEGTEVASLYGAVRNGRAYGVNLRWVSDRELHVEYLTAKSAEVLPSRMLAPSVHVTLESGISDSSAPPGGMLYNLQGRPPLGG
jgi:hypothetical protein